MYDVIFVGGGPAGLYGSLIVQKGTPVQRVSENFKVKVIESGNTVGGITKYAFIQISKGWAFSGKSLISTLYEEAKRVGVEFSLNEVVLRIDKNLDNEVFTIYTNKDIYESKIVVLATGIMTFPDAMSKPEKFTVGLHTPEEMINEFTKEYNWKSILVAGNHQGSIEELAINLESGFDSVGTYLIPEKSTIDSEQYGIPKELATKYDGVVFDYGSYKLINGTTQFLKNLNLNMYNGYIVTDAFEMTNIENLYAIGSMTTVLSGVPAAIYSAQIAAIDIGRKLNLETKADSSGRFPFVPREQFWADSWQKILKDNIN